MFTWRKPILLILATTLAALQEVNLQTKNVEIVVDCNSISMKQLLLTNSRSYSDNRRNRVTRIIFVVVSVAKTISLSIALIKTLLICSDTGLASTKWPNNITEALSFSNYPENREISTRWALFLSATTWMWYGMLPTSKTISSRIAAFCTKNTANCLKALTTQCHSSYFGRSYT